jgi:hypothetical protein
VVEALTSLPIGEQAAASDKALVEAAIKDTTPATSLSDSVRQLDDMVNKLNDTVDQHQLNDLITQLKAVVA